MRISRSGFVGNLEGKRVNVDELKDSRRLSTGAKNHLASADLNRDGFIEGSRETNQLFNKLDDYDRDGNRNTITPNRTQRVLHEIVAGATETASRPAPNTPQGRLQTLLAQNPGVETNQDLINLFMRRNRNNYGAASSDARRHGLDMNSLVRNRRGRVENNGVSGPAPTPPTGDNTPVDGIGRVIGMQNTTASFRRKVAEIAGRLRMNPTHLMAVMSFETGGSFSPSERNRVSGATGLIQFMPTTARSLGTSTSELARMSPERQLDYVERYLRPFTGRMRTVEDAYMAVLQPIAIGKGASHTLFRSPRVTYRQNRGLDLNRDGRITVGEASKKVRDRIL